MWTKKHWFDPWVRKIPWRRTWQHTLVFLPGESQGQKSLVDYSPWGHKESEWNNFVHYKSGGKSLSVPVGFCPLGPQVPHFSWLSRFKREATKMWVMSTELITTHGKSTRKRRKPWQKGWAKPSILVEVHHKHSQPILHHPPTLFSKGVRRSTSCQSKAPIQQDP